MGYRITEIGSNYLNNIVEIKNYDISQLPNNYQKCIERESKINVFLLTHVISYNRSIYYHNNIKKYGHSPDDIPLFFYEKHEGYSDTIYELYLNSGKDTFSEIDKDNSTYYYYSYNCACPIYFDLKYLLSETNTEYNVIKSPCDKSKYIIYIYDKVTNKNVYIVRINGDYEIDENDLEKGMEIMYEWLLNYNK